jgi:hypothetical protein
LFQTFTRGVVELMERVTAWDGESWEE